MYSPESCAALCGSWLLSRLPGVRGQPSWVTTFAIMGRGATPEPYVEDIRQRAAPESIGLLSGAAAGRK